MKRTIKKVGVLGSGVMGSRIACHFAGVGVQVLLLDIVAKEFTESTKPAERNKIVNDALATAIKSNPSPVYTKDVVKRITTGNFTDNMKDIAACDWIIEVVVERLDIKQQVFTEVEKYRKPGTLITSTPRTSQLSNAPISQPKPAIIASSTRYISSLISGILWEKQKSI